MSWNESQNDPLDELLRKADLPEPQSDQIARLEAGWRSTVRRRQIRSAAISSTLAISACLLAALVVSRGNPEQIPPVSEQPRTGWIATEMPSLVREPNAVERAVVVLERRRRQAREHQHTPIPAPVPNQPAIVNQEPPVEDLFAAMSNERMSVRRAAAQTLGGLNNPAVSNRLARMVLNNVNRREALIALLSSSDPVARQFLAAAEQNLELAPSVRALVPRFSVE